MKVLVTGATGFIGRRLVASLEGDEVIGVARESRDDMDIRWVKADLSNPDFVQHLPASVDAVVHAAQSPLYRQFPSGASDMFAVNVAATQRLLDWSIARGVETFVYLSSGSVYEPYDGVLAEDAPLSPTSYYSASKLSGELLAAAYGEMMRCVSLRLFFPYGPGQKDRLIPALIERVKSGRPIDLAGDQGMTIAPVYVGDVVSLIRVALFNEAMHGPINVAGAEALSLREIGELIAQTLGVEASFLQHPGDAVTIVPDLERLRRFVSLDSFCPFIRGLKETLESERESIGAA